MTIFVHSLNLMLGKYEVGLSPFTQLMLFVADADLMKMNILELLICRYWIFSLNNLVLMKLHFKVLALTDLSGSVTLLPFFYSSSYETRSQALLSCSWARKIHRNKLLRSTLQFPSTAGNTCKGYKAYSIVCKECPEMSHFILAKWQMGKWDEFVG